MVEKTRTVKITNSQIIIDKRRLDVLSRTAFRWFSISEDKFVTYKRID